MATQTITEKMVVDRFSEIQTLNDATKFSFWIDENSLNMTAELYEVATVAINYKSNELRENFLNKLKPLNK